MAIKHPRDPAVETQLAKDLFNYVWTLLDKPARTPEEDEQMVHAAHASRWHWSQVGTPLQLARGDWQIARVYATLKRVAAARHYAELYLCMCEEQRLGAFDLSFAYEGLARAEAAAGDRVKCDEWLKKARAAGTLIQDVEDRKWLEKNLAEIATDKVGE